MNKPEIHVYKETVAEQIWRPLIALSFIPFMMIVGGLMVLADKLCKGVGKA